MRGHRVEDWAACAALWGDSRVTRYIGGVPLTAEETWSRLLRYTGHWAMLDFGFWVVEERSTGAIVGEAGFASYKRILEPPLEEIPEVGWAFTPSCHGKGYATEATRAALAWGETHLETPRTCCLIHPENLPSIRVAQKCGFQEVRRASYKQQPTIVFHRPGAGAERGS